MSDAVYVNQPFCDCHQEYGEGLIEALGWYEEKVRLCRKIAGIPEGEAARHALSADGGGRARRALSANYSEAGADFVTENGEVIAWECKDFADGWIRFTTLISALAYQHQSGCIMRPVWK